MEAAAEVILHGHFAVDDVALECREVDCDVLKFFAREEVELQRLGACEHFHVSGR